MPLLLVLNLCPFNMSLSYAPAECPYFMSLQHVFHIPVTCPHFRPCNMFLFKFTSLQHGSISYSAVCSHFISMLLVRILCSCNMSLSHVPRACSYFSSLWHVRLSLPCDMSLFHILVTCPHFTPLQHVPVSHPCNMSPFYAPATCTHFMSQPSGLVLLSFFFSCWLRQLW